MLWQFLAWYLIIQLITLITVPLGVTLFVNLPDRGYAFIKSLGILLVGFLFWLGYSYGLLRNETGGAWLAVILVGLISLGVGRQQIPFWRSPAQRPGVLRWRYVLLIELIFLAFFAFWAYVRAHDPAVDHTEEPMDLMFMNSIWVSPTFPPHDAWLSGYAIGYYYFGYWLLTTLGRLAGQPPEIAYTLGQASWYGLLWIGAFGLLYNLLAYRDGPGLSAVLGGLLGALTVAFAGNAQGFFEWLYAKGYDITAVARWFNVTNFPALQGPGGGTGNWYVSYDWWWWRSSRVISDRGLTGGHIEVIDEFPLFSYLLGDNHPHVIAMPIAILLVALALNLFLHKRRVALPIPVAAIAPTAEPTAAEQVADSAEPEHLPAATETTETTEITQTTQTTPWLSPLVRSPLVWRELVASAVPLGGVGAALVVVALGSLIFLNTWDLPPYWFLLVASLGSLIWRNLGTVPTLSTGQRNRQSLLVAALAAVALLIASGLLYYPYLLTAQSQASGLVPNLFNPTRLPQFLLMFGHAIFALLGLLGLSWQWLHPRSTGWQWRILGGIGALVLGLPLLVLGLSTILVSTARGQELLATNMPLPAESSGYLPHILERWGSSGWTFLLLGVLLTLCIWLAWHFLQQLVPPDGTAEAGTPQRHREIQLFVLLLAVTGLILIFAPEFIYLRDNFGTRMNTVFKFYYQAWLLLGIGSSYVIVTALRQMGGRLPDAVNPGGAASTNGLLRTGTFVSAILSVIIISAGLFYPVMAIYSKSGGLQGEGLTFNSIAYLQTYGPDEWAAIEWVRERTANDAVVVEGKGLSYRSNYNRISTTTGRPTLLGWDGHERQWRGKEFDTMAQGRDQALEVIYRGGTPQQIERVLDEWGIDYVYVGPVERNSYGLAPQAERNLATAMDLVFTAGDVHIYERRR